MKEDVGGAAGHVGGFAEAVEHPRFAAPLTDLANDREGPLEVPDRLAGLAESSVDDAEVVQRARLAIPVAERPKLGQCLLVVRGRRPVVAEPPLDEAEVVERVGLSVPVTDLPVERQGLPVVFGGRLVVAQPPPEEAEVVERVGLAVLVAGLPKHGQGLLVVVGRRPDADFRNNYFPSGVTVDNNIQSASNSTTGNYRSVYYKGYNYSNYNFCVNPGGRVESWELENNGVRGDYIGQADESGSLRLIAGASSACFF